MRTRLLRPTWLVMHVLVVALLVLMYRLGVWQWGRGEATGSIRNYSYGLEWWAFVLLTVLGWVKFCLDETAAPGEEQAQAPDARAAAAAAPLPAAVPVAEDDDPELAAWNARLAELARRDAEQRS